MKKLAYIFLITMAISCSAQADLFRVEVPITTTADTAVMAKEQALNEAGNQAFSILMKRIVLSSDAGSVTASASEVARLIQGFSIANEKTTATKYMADVSVQFKPKEVQDFLKTKGLPFSAKMPPKFLFIPLFREGAAAQVFDESSPLFQAVKTTSPNTSVYQFVIPSGDLQDMATATPMILMGSDMGALSTLLSKYEVDYALIMKVTKTGTIYKVEISSYPAHTASGADITFAVSSKSDDLTGVMNQIVQKATTEMEKKWKANQIQRGNHQTQMTIILPINGLSEWTVLEKRLKVLPFLDSVSIQALHQNRVFVQITATDEMDIIAQKMKTAGFPIVQQYDSTWLWEKENVPMSSNTHVPVGTPIVDVTPEGGSF